MNKDELRNNLLKYSEYLSKRNDSNYIMDLNTSYIVSKIMDESRTNPELNEIVEKLKNADNINEYESIISNYLSKLELKSINEDKEAISKVFGIDITDIEHRVLNNEKEIFSFYDRKLGRNRILENLYKGESLTEQLKKSQNENEKFQTENYKENSYQMLDEKTKEFDCEFDMVYIGDIYKYDYIISKMDKEKLESLKKLLSRKDELDIKYINLENLVALDKDGKIYESLYDEKKQEAIVEEPKEYSYNKNEMSNDENSKANKNDEKYDEENNELNKDETKEVTNDITYDDLEDIPKLIEAQLVEEGYNKSDVDIKQMSENVIKYYKNPDSMLYLTEHEREFYERFVNILASKMELKNDKNNSNVKVYRLDEEKMAGFSNTFLLTLIVIVLAILLIIYIMQFLR